MAEDGGFGRPAATLLVLSIVLGGMLLVAAPATSGSNQETSAEPTLTTFTFVGDFKFWPFDMVFEVFDSNGESVLLVHQDDNTEDHQLVLTPGIYTVEARVEASSLSVPIKTRAFDSQEYGHVTVKVRYVVQTEVISLAFIAYLGLTTIRRVFRPSIPTGIPTTSGKPTTTTGPPKIDPPPGKTTAPPVPPIDKKDAHSLQIEWNGQVIKSGTCCTLEIFANTTLDEWQSNYWHTSNKYEVDLLGSIGSGNHKTTPKLIGDKTKTDSPSVKWSREENVGALFVSQAFGNRQPNHSRYPRRAKYCKVGSNSSLVNASIYGPHVSIFSRDVRFWKNPYEEVLDQRDERLQNAFTLSPFMFDTATLSKVRHVITNEGKSSSQLRMNFTSKHGVKATYEIDGFSLASNQVSMKTRRKKRKRAGGGWETVYPYEEDTKRHFGKAAAAVGGDTVMKLNTGWSLKKKEFRTEKNFLHPNINQDDLDKGTRFELIKKDQKSLPEQILTVLGLFDPTPLTDVVSFMDLLLHHAELPYVPGKGPHSITAYSPPLEVGFATDTEGSLEHGAFELIGKHDFSTIAMVEALYQKNRAHWEGNQIAHAGRDTQYKIEVNVSFHSTEKGCKGVCESESVFLSLSPEPDELLGDTTPEKDGQPRDPAEERNLFHEHGYGEEKEIRSGPYRVFSKKVGVGRDTELPMPHGRYYMEDEDGTLGQLSVEDRVRADSETPQRRRKYTGILECSSGKYSVYCQEAVNVGELVKWELDASDWRMPKTQFLRTKEPPAIRVGGWLLKGGQLMGNDGRKRSKEEE